MKTVLVGPEFLAADAAPLGIQGSGTQLIKNLTRIWKMVKFEFLEAEQKFLFKVQIYSFTLTTWKKHTAALTSMGWKA